MRNKEDKHNSKLNKRKVTLPSLPMNIHGYLLTVRINAKKIIASDKL